MVQCVTPATSYAAQGHTVCTKCHKKLPKMPNPKQTHWRSNVLAKQNDSRRWTLFILTSYTET